MSKKPKPNLKAIRKQIRQARQAIPKNYSAQASYKFSESIGGLESYQTASRIGAYVPFEGEADSLPLMDRAILEGKEVYVPIIVAKDTPLKFAAWSRDAKTRKNSFGIDEPDVAADELLDGTDLDFVITPLVAFDDRCNRIGVGGGFYDRTFAVLNGVESKDRTTQLIGIAFEMQRIDAIDSQDWDVRLDGVVTELMARQWHLL